jgi:transposase
MIKAVLLTLLQNRILDSQTVADILGYTRSHTLHLKRQIFAGSMEEVLFDSRQGQKQCYVFNSEVKAELIQQCLANAIVGKSTSSEVLASSLKERCGLDLSQRSIRYHVQKLGLKYIKKTLPQIIEQLKKNSGK